MRKSKVCIAKNLQYYGVSHRTHKEEGGGGFEAMRIFFGQVGRGQFIAIF